MFKLTHPETRLLFRIAVDRRNRAEGSNDAVDRDEAMAARSIEASLLSDHSVEEIYLGEADLWLSEVEVRSNNYDAVQTAAVLRGKIAARRKVH